MRGDVSNCPWCGDEYVEDGRTLKECPRCSRVLDGLRFGRWGPYLAVAGALMVAVVPAVGYWGFLPAVVALAASVWLLARTARAIGEAR